MTVIIESSENLNLETIYTIITDDKKEFVLNVDRALCAIAEALADTTYPRDYVKQLSSILAASKDQTLVWSEPPF